MVGSRVCKNILHDCVDDVILTELYKKGNTRTHWLDNSNIYGSLPDVAASLREFRYGKLKINAKQILPQRPNNGTCDYDCYYAGWLFFR